MHGQGVRFAYFCLVAVLAATTVFAAGNNDIDGRIVGGQETSINSVPYLVQMKDKSRDRFFCGGTLITDRHVLTASHCVDKRTASNIMVVAGANYTYDRGEQRNVAKFIMHPQYNQGVAINFDVAVLVLDRPMTGPIATPMTLTSSPIKPDGYIQVSGWGKTSESSATSSPKVRTVKVPIHSREVCDKQYGKEKISETMFCASQPGTQDSCSGDSGGPAISEGRLVGIVSWGYGCARENSPGVYTDVFTVLPFINDCLTL